MKRLLFIAALSCLLSTKVLAQTTHQNTGWLFLMNSTKINEKWGAHFDLQLRSSDNWEDVRNLLIRPGVTYFIDKQNDVTLGYLFTQTYSQAAGVKNALTENRIWQQYIHKHKISSVNISHRFRLEQRFIERANNDDLFAQRARYFVRALIPLQKKEDAFDKGPFAALQNELFFNIQGKSGLNGHVFDQNRAYLAAGYRFSKKMDVEAGYMNQAVKGAVSNTNNNIIQLAVYTRF
ncbi:DUF2490 domain-containing protein [Pedobacter frigoris]|uniref:DUF2490 domain-containing protein n=1 Tax=Pedobacter frigoris TaxID=2571272 RepID=A0A4U1CDT1_9SPHI|nr:DUF2490 domain-containing protein [Pedobacter frigoris]TKC04288.1 DUF2490 domain-containing protein [Pedobacter frigoris]